MRVQGIKVCVGGGCVCLSVRVHIGTARCGVTPRGCCLLQHLCPCSGEAAEHRGSVSGEGQGAPVLERGLPTLSPHLGATAGLRVGQEVGA